MGFDKDEMAKRLEKKRIEGYQKSKQLSENQTIVAALMTTGPVGVAAHLGGLCQAKRCPKCHEKLQKEAKFCPECGLEL